MVVTHGSLQRARGRCALTIGNFDGVHRGHRALVDPRFAALPPERFVEDLLVAGLGMRALTIGRDFRYGARRAGDFATLEAAAKRHAFSLEAMDDVEFEGRRVSSSAGRP